MNSLYINWNVCQCDKNSSKGYLPISLLTPSKLQEILNEVKKVSQVTNPYYDIVIKRLSFCFDMK